MDTNPAQVKFQDASDNAGLKLDYLHANRPFYGKFGFKSVTLVMKAKLKRLAKITFQSICLSALCACQTERPSATLSAAPEPPLAFPDVPVPPPPQDESAVLMAKYGESLRGWNPIKIYRDVGNLVVVQRIAFGVESGKYIMPMVSSYLPETNGDGGFKITLPQGSQESTFTNFEAGALGEDIGAAIVWDYHKKLQAAR